MSLCRAAWSALKHSKRTISSRPTGHVSLSSVVLLEGPSAAHLADRLRRDERLDQRVDKRQDGRGRCTASPAAQGNYRRAPWHRGARVTNCCAGGLGQPPRLACPSGLLSSRRCCGQLESSTCAMSAHTPRQSPRRSHFAGVMQHARAVDRTPMPVPTLARRWVEVAAGWPRARQVVGKHLRSLLHVVVARCHEALPLDGRHGREHRLGAHSHDGRDPISSRGTRAGCKVSRKNALRQREAEGRTRLKVAR